MLPIMVRKFSGSLMDEKHFICVGIFIEIIRVTIVLGAASPIVQSLFSSIALRLSRKSSCGCNSKPFRSRDFMFFPMAILGSTE
jgi:hypothetical protein